MHDHVPMYANMYGVCCSKLFVNAVTLKTIKCDPGMGFSVDKNKHSFLCQHIHQSEDKNKLLNDQHG